MTPNPPSLDLALPPGIPSAPSELAPEASSTPSPDPWEQTTLAAAFDAAPSGAALGAPMRAPGTHGSADPNLAGLPILLVDDEPMLTEVIQAYLEEAGYRRITAVNQPEEVLQTASALQPSLIMLDLLMPRVSGFELLTKLRADDRLRYVPVIVLTAANDAATKLRALDLGATEFLTKPVDASELVIRVRNALALKVYQDRLANYDPVTGLPNRRKLAERLERSLRARRGASQRVAVLHVGLDRFRQLASTLGPSTCDQLLSRVAARLRSATRRDDDERQGSGVTPVVVSRADSDSFVIVLMHLADPQLAGGVAQRILSDLAKSFHIDGHEIHVSPSIGIAMAPEDGQSVDELIRNAASAMELARIAGRSEHRFFSKAFNQASLERLRLETHLRRAIGANELGLAFQPKLSCKTGRIVGAEALLRWRHPELGVISPAQFIPLAEQTGLIIELGRWVMERACATLGRWQGQGFASLKLAFNMSSHELAAPGVLESLADAMSHHGVPASCLVCELTESALVERLDEAQQRVRDMRALGVELSIDDFGTGYSSMSTIRHFPLDELKIDRSFITDLPQDAAAVAILRAIVVLGHSLGMRVVAEGIETAPQRDALRQLGVDQLQGYLLGRPMPLSHFEHMVRAQQAAGAAKA